MDVCEEDFPEHYRPIIRQMKKATESIDIRYRMDMEVWGGLIMPDIKIREKGEQNFFEAKDEEPQFVHPSARKRFCFFQCKISHFSIAVQN